MKKFVLNVIQRILANLAKRVILRFNPFVIAVTGSVGKSSTKEAIYRVMRDHFGEEVRKNYGNFNTEIGLPLAILGYEKLPAKILWPLLLLKITWVANNLKSYPKYLVLEMGIDKPGDMQYLASIAKPDIAIITSIAADSISTAHVANFNNLESYQREKMAIIRYLKPQGKVIVNADDDLLAKQKIDNVIKVGVKNRRADYRAEVISLSLSSIEYRISCTGHKISIKSNILGQQIVYSALFAFAVADTLKIPLINVGKTLEKIKTLPGRMNLIEGRDNTLIIDDTYNANPISVKAALDFLSEIDYSHRRVVILGNMNELGEKESEAHRDIGKYARGKCDLALFVGPNAKAMAEGYGAQSAKIYASREEVIKSLPELINKDDLILIKASQGNNYFEEIVKKLMKEPDQAPKLLVRQGKGWRRKR